ncbi:hypothetical protein GCK72_021772 [Caenorhabditis remanei]|uniref:Serpentine receptor class gamma n=1 Tax=Caenorhabditis remanei TaxID=31234 RepID=A0A6A5GKN9_CAERE|nr:hypothetical protein GCK72_021772 [Caenorhabditis remanei]KAF1755203.1 hypothetical protein GCK72_021772 [Caenorhabditis remanei]
MKRLVRTLYGLATSFMLLVWTLKYINESVANNLQLAYFLFLNVLVVFSSLLYVPIVISIRKFTNLASAQVNQPQRYVAWQLVAVVAEKIIVYSVIFTKYMFTNNNIDNALFYCKYSDEVSLPLVLQLTYLGCNRRNLQALFTSLKSNNFPKTIRSICFFSRQVEPVTDGMVLSQIISTVAN